MKVEMLGGPQDGLEYALPDDAKVLVVTIPGPPKARGLYTQPSPPVDLAVPLRRSERGKVYAMWEQRRLA